MRTNWVSQESRLSNIVANPEISAFSDLIATIYQGPLETPPWAEALELIRRELQASYVTLILRVAADDRRAPLSIHASEFGSLMPVGGAESYNNYYYSLDPFIGLPSDRVVTVDEVFGITGWQSSELYKQFLKPHDVRYILGADLRTSSMVECRFRVCRNHASKPFSEHDKAFCALLLPHLKRAIELHSRLDSVEVERSIYANAVNRMEVGTITLDESGAIIDTNAVSDEILKEGDGLRIARGMIEATDGQENRRLQRLIRQAVMGHHAIAAAIVEAMPIKRSRDRHRLGLLVRTVLLSDWSEDNKRRPAVTLFLRDPDRKPQGAQEMMRKLFDLTPAESAIALLLMNGLTLEETAEESGISKNTARTHLRSIFAKTGATRQATLVRILLGSIVPLG